MGSVCTGQQILQKWGGRLQWTLRYNHTGNTSTCTSACAAGLYVSAINLQLLANMTKKLAYKRMCFCMGAKLPQFVKVHLLQTVPLPSVFAQVALLEHL